MWEGQHLWGPSHQSHHPWANSRRWPLQVQPPFSKVSFSGEFLVILVRLTNTNEDAQVQAYFSHDILDGLQGRSTQRLAATPPPFATAIYFVELRLTRPDAYSSNVGSEAKICIAFTMAVRFAELSLTRPTADLSILNWWIRCRGLHCSTMAVRLISSG